MPIEPFGANGLFLLLSDWSQYTNVQNENRTRFEILKNKINKNRSNHKNKYHLALTYFIKYNVKPIRFTISYTSTSRIKSYIMEGWGGGGRCYLHEIPTSFTVYKGSH